MAEQAFAPERRDYRWQGPLISEHRAHLELVVKRQPGYLPEFNDMVAKVASDYRFEQRQRQMREAEVRLVSKYRIEQCNPPPQPASGNGPLPDRCRSVVMAPLKGWTGCVGGTAKFTRKAGSK